MLQEAGGIKKKRGFARISGIPGQEQQGSPPAALLWVQETTQGKMNDLETNKEMPEDLEINKQECSEVLIQQKEVDESPGEAEEMCAKEEGSENVVKSRVKEMVVKKVKIEKVLVKKVKIMKPSRSLDRRSHDEEGSVIDSKNDELQVIKKTVKFWNNKTGCKDLDKRQEHLGEEKQFTREEKLCIWEENEFVTVPWG